MSQTASYHVEIILYYYYGIIIAVIIKYIYYSNDNIIFTTVESALSQHHGNWEQKEVLEMETDQRLI